jgi:hypothetical protein
MSSDSRTRRDAFSWLAWRSMGSGFGVCFGVIRVRQGRTQRTRLLRHLERHKTSAKSSTVPYIGWKPPQPDVRQPCGNATRPRRIARRARHRRTPGRAEHLTSPVPRQGPRIQVGVMPSRPRRLRSAPAAGQRAVARKTAHIPVVDDEVVRCGTKRARTRHPGPHRLTANASGRKPAGGSRDELRDR